MTDARTRTHGRRPAHLFPLWERCGKAITERGFGEDRVAQHFDVSGRTARTLVRLVKAEGPVPYRSGTRTHLVIGDPHVHPGQDLRRFRWLARLIIDVDPDVVVCVGDWPSLGSLSHFDVGRIEAEGQRYVHDVAAVRDSLSELHREIRRYNETCGQYKTINPRFEYVAGNHGWGRLEKYMSCNPALGHALSFKDLSP